MDRITAMKEALKVERQILKVEAILVKLRDRQADLLRELSGG